MLLLPFLPLAFPAPSGPRWGRDGGGFQKESDVLGEEGKREEGGRELRSRAASGEGCRGARREEEEAAEQGCGRENQITGKAGEQPWGRGAPGRQERGRCSEVKTENKKLPGEMTDSRSTRHPWQRGAQGRAGAPGGAGAPGRRVRPAYLVRRWARSSRGASAAQCPDIASAACRGFYFACFLNLEAEHSAISFKTDIQPPEWRVQH